MSAYAGYSGEGSGSGYARGGPEAREQEGAQGIDREMAHDQRAGEVANAAAASEQGDNLGAMLDLNLVNASVRIIGDVPDRTKTGYHRGPIGTGFVLAVPSEADPRIHLGYVATAHHVLDGQTRIEVQMPDPRSLAREVPLNPVEVRDWRQPLAGIDLAIAPFLPVVDTGDGAVATSALPVGMHFLPPEKVPPVGGDVYYVGFFDPLKRVMVRSGTLGALFQEGIEHEGDYEYLCHLVDCRSYNGFSGSPCYAKYEFAKMTPMEESNFPFPMHPQMAKEFPLSETLDRTLFCGIFTEHIEDRDPRGDVSRYGVGIMLPSIYVWEALYSDGEIAERKRADARRSQAGDQSEPKVTEAAIKSPPDAEYERFEEMARQFVNTPKPKPDEEAS